MPEEVFTIGHSTHNLERFIALLRMYEITAVGDVRSSPYSRANPQFNREDLKQALRDAGIEYVFLGDELGARSKDPTCYEEGRVQYNRLALTPEFQRGLGRVQQGMKRFRLALMCAEKEPLECHRTVLVARRLVELGISVMHILADGRLESHEQTIGRLKRALHLPETDMFRTAADVLQDAYKLQETRIAYRPSEGGETPEIARSTGE